MALPTNNELFVAANYLQTYFVDKQTGLPLAAGLVYFWHDNNRNDPKPVYQLTSAPNYIYTPLPNPLTLSNAGTFVDGNGNDIAVYFYPYDNAGEPDNYYIQVFAAGTIPAPPGGIPMLTREAVPGIIPGAGPNESGPQSFENAIANSQFSEVLFNPAQPLSINYNAGITTVPVAPGWFLEITAAGAGTTTITRTSEGGNSGIPTNPAYTLSVTPGANISSLIMYQRFYHNPGIFGGGWISGSITLGPASPTAKLNYKDSAGNSTLILSNANAGAWTTYNATVPITASGNAQTSDNGYVDIQVILNEGNTTRFTSVQVVGMATDTQNVSFNQETVNEQATGLFYYHQPQINFKPIPSYLTGWDFPLNPAQFGETQAASLAAAKSKYVWDQTILFQSSAAGFRVTRATNGAMRVACEVAGQFALIQYLDGNTVKEILNNRLAVNVSAATNVVGGLQGTVSLWYTQAGALPVVTTGTNNSIVLSLDANGFPTNQGGPWVEVPRGKLGNAQFTLPVNTTNNFTDTMLSGWDLVGDVGLETATFFAIVVGFKAEIAANTVDVNSISLCAGDIATRPAPKTPDETLRACERYWEMSYATAAQIDTGVLTNAIAFPLTATTPVAGPLTTAQPGAFHINFKSTKRVTNPIVTPYSPVNATGGGVVNIYWQAGIGVNGTFDIAILNSWTATLGNKYVHWIPINDNIGGQHAASALTTPTVYSLRFHYTAEARLGIV